MNDEIAGWVHGNFKYTPLLLLFEFERWVYTEIPNKEHCPSVGLTLADPL